MIEMGIIAIMFMVLIYSFVRKQALHREIKIAQNTSKSINRKLKLTQKQLVSISHELQAIFLARLESVNKRGLLKQEQYQIASFILNRFEFVVMNCVEHDSTLEEAVNRSLLGQAVKIEQINQFIKDQPNDIKVAWCQNKIDGYLAACRGISTGPLNLQAADQATAAKTE
jgi:ABC-type anion transport system duplicated permease subunit